MQSFSAAVYDKSRALSMQFQESIQALEAKLGESTGPCANLTMILHWRIAHSFVASHSWIACIGSKEADNLLGQIRSLREEKDAEARHLRELLQEQKSLVSTLKAGTKIESFDSWRVSSSEQVQQNPFSNILPSVEFTELEAAHDDARSCRTLVSGLQLELGDSRRLAADLRKLNETVTEKQTETSQQLESEKRSRVEMEKELEELRRVNVVEGDFLQTICIIFRIIALSEMIFTPPIKKKCKNAASCRKKSMSWRDWQRSQTAWCVGVKFFFGYSCELIFFRLLLVAGQELRSRTSERLARSARGTLPGS
jgi:hypothetical protein